MSYSWIKKLNESDSRLHKEAVIQQALDMTKLGGKNAQVFLSLTRSCYSPFITWGVKQVPETSNIENAENPWDDFDVLLSKLASRALTGHAARDEIAAMSLRFDSDEWNHFCRSVLRKDLRAGISEKTINKICKKTEYEVPVFGCQLATNSEGRPEMSGKKRLEGKLDGCRMLLMVQTHSDQYMDTVSVTTMSRNGKEFENFTEIQSQVMAYVNDLLKQPELKNGFVLDGEVMGASFQELMKQARRKTAAKADDSVYHVFDIVPIADFNRGYWNAQQEKRLAILEKLEKTFDKMPNVTVTEGIEVDLDTPEGREQYETYCRESVEAGLEGVMIKDLGAPYLCKRSTSWMKYKPVYDYDLKIISIEEGTGKNKGRTGALVCKGTDGASGKYIEVNVGSGMTDEERDLFWANPSMVVGGKTAVVLADAITQNADGSYSLRFPRLDRIRDDK
jgi:DNA ligase 1